MAFKAWFFLLLLVASPSHAQPLAKDLPRISEPKLILSHYMAWYETPAGHGRWGSHWTGPRATHHPDALKDGLPDLWSHYHPLIGPYDSADPDLLECHLLQMKIAGIDGVIVDWYGTADAADYPSIHHAAQAMFEAAARFQMTFAVCYEDRSIEWMVQSGKLKPEDAGSHLKQTVAWLNENWFPQPQYCRLEDRPLLLNFGPIYVKDAATWNSALEGLSPRPALYALHHLWKSSGADGGFTWVHPDVWKDNPDAQTVRQRLHGTFTATAAESLKVIVSACPGFRDVYEQSYPAIDHRGGETLRESLDAVMSGPWPTVQLVTWNDYGEGTMIEPTHEFGYAFLEVIQQVRRKEKGTGFTYTEQDLRLPARLYVLRKKGNVPARTLDRISQLLNAGRCDLAGKELRERGG